MVDREASALAGLVGVVGARADSDEAQEAGAGVKVGDVGVDVDVELDAEVNGVQPLPEKALKAIIDADERAERAERYVSLSLSPLIYVYAH